jgi:protease-4
VDSNAGKFLVGYMAVGGEKEYYLASLCPELYCPPGAYISIVGLKVQGQFLGGKYDLNYVLHQ